jgi:hypothetical protein
MTLRQTKERASGARSHSLSIRVNPGFKQARPGRSLNSVISAPNLIRILLILVGLIGILAIFYFSWKRNPKPKKEKRALLLLHLDNVEPSSTIEQGFHPKIEDAASVAPPSRKPAFTSLQQPSGAITDIFRAFLIVFSLAIAAGFVLILLPQRTIDKMAHGLQSRHAGARPEKIALLYLGDEAKEGTLRIRGILRNIAPQPIEQLDAAIRLYARDGSLLETILVRMDKETIAPDEIARLELVVPNHATEYATYALEFKMRQGETVAYKDMRKIRSQQ